MGSSKIKDAVRDGLLRFEVEKLVVKQKKNFIPETEPITEQMAENQVYVNINFTINTMKEVQCL